MVHEGFCLFIASHRSTPHHGNVWRTNRWSTCCTELAKDRDHHSSYSLDGNRGTGGRQQFDFRLMIEIEENDDGNTQTKCRRWGTNQGEPLYRWNVRPTKNSRS